MIRFSTFARTAAVAAVTFACAIACAWPTLTEADDFEGRPADVGVNTTVVGRIRATSRLVEDAHVKGKWYLEIEAKNLNASEAETADLQEEVMRESMANMMARSGPIPTVAWKVSEKIRVLPNETAVVRHPLPAWLSAQVAASAAPPKLNKNGEPVVSSRVSFLTSIDAHAAPQQPQPANVQVAQVKMPSRRSLAVRKPQSNAAPMARAYLEP
jgi:hypothetical protein